MGAIAIRRASRMLDWTPGGGVAREMIRAFESLSQVMPSFGAELMHSSRRAGRAACYGTLGAGLLCLSVACANPGADTGRDRHEVINSPVPVETATAQVQTVPITVEAVGSVEAVATVEVRAQVTGQLRSVLFAPGQLVRKGQPLFLLDARPFEAALRQAEAVVSRDTAQAADARGQLTRMQNLFGRGLVPRDQLEAQRASSAALEATVVADRALVDQARRNLQYARIEAPITGRTGELLANAGDLVRANDANPLVTINQLAPIYVSFPVPARLLPQVRRQSAAGALSVTAHESSSAAPSTHEEGRVTFIDNAVDPASATILLKATFANESRDLWPGLFVQVTLRLAEQDDAIVVPATAVQSSQDGQYVYVVTPEGTAQVRDVTVDRQQGPSSVIASGLRGGERVVTDGHLRLTPGAQVALDDEATD
jgi:multidrug efflux system membrane fusion protein